MTEEWSLPAWLVLVTAAAAALLLLALVALVAATVRRARATRLLVAGVAQDTAGLREQLAVLERRLAPHPGGPEAHPGTERPAASYVITRLGDEPEPAGSPVPVVPPAAFADAVLREGVVQTASLLHGVRRALSPEVRHRVRFEVRREVKRSRKARRTEQRAALRDWQARQRAEAPGDAA